MCDLFGRRDPKRISFSFGPLGPIPVLQMTFPLCSPRKLRQSLDTLLSRGRSSQYTSGYGIGAVLLSSKSAFYYLSIPTQHPLPPTFSTSLLSLQQTEVECPVVSVSSLSAEKKKVFCVVCSVCVCGFLLNRRGRFACRETR